MDIAELRKKAKQAGSSNGSPEVRQASVAETGPQTDLPAAASTGPLDSYQGKSVVDPVSEETAMQKIDKLFSIDASLELAILESHEISLSGDSGDADHSVRQCLAFLLGREEYALDICSISEIIKVREFTEVPRTPAFVLGIISLRGVVVPVFDLAARLRLGQADMTGDSRIVVCQDGELIVGLLVDSISQVIKLKDDGIEPPPAVLSGLDRDFMTGVGRYQGRMVILLNIANVLNVELN